MKPLTIKGAASTTQISPAESEPRDRQRECRGSGPGKIRCATVAKKQEPRLLGDVSISLSPARFEMPDEDPPETIDPVLLHHPTRRSVAYIGTMSLRDGKMVYRREAGRFNAETFFAFLRQRCAVSFRSRRRVAVITDNVCYRHAALYKVCPQAGEPWFKLQFLPPHSPDLSPIDSVWKLMRSPPTYNRYFLPIDDVITAGRPTFDRWLHH